MTRATYSPEDNKLRIYPEGERIDKTLTAEEYQSFKAAGYKWAGKQECFVAPRWTPTAEDWALKLCGEIDDEDYSPEERAADRAERFEGYRGKRATEATGRADAFDAGPQAFGHQNRARAERQAARHDRHRVGAVSQWSKAEYWQQRTAGVIRHALHKSSPAVRRGRILTIEANQRKFLKDVAEAQERYDAWREVINMPGADELLPLEGDNAEWNAAQRKAYQLANVGSWWHTAHPTSEEANAKQRELRQTFAGFSAYDFLTKTDYLGAPFQRLTPKQVAELYVARVKNPAEQKSWIRWREHYELRLTYERAMLDAEGGTAAAVDMEPGGWIRVTRRHWQMKMSQGQFLQIQKVNKSPVTGRVVSVQVQGPTYCDYDKHGNAYGPDNPRPMVLHSINIERSGEDAYRAPTDEEREAFKASKKSAPKGPTLLNPTDEDAERLQAIWNAARLNQSPAKVERMTQAQYTRRSKYDTHGARSIGADGKQRSDTPTAFKVRSVWRMYGPDSVIVLTDKPQKPLPLDWDKIEGKAEAKPAPAKVEAPKPPAEPVPAGLLF